MSPAKGRKQFVPGRPRAELITAIAVGAAIVLGTALLIWLIRPGPAGVPGKGGLLSRQPRMTLLVLATVAAVAGVVFTILGRRHPPRLGRVWTIGLGAGAVVVLGIVAGIVWPGGVVRHWNSGHAPIAPVATSTTSTSAGTATTAKPATGTTATSATTTTKGR